MKLSYRFKVAVMTGAARGKEAVAAAKAGDMEKFEYLSDKSFWNVEQAVIAAGLPEALCYFLDHQKYTETGKFMLLWDLTKDNDKTELVSALLESNPWIGQHMKDALLADTLKRNFYRREESPMVPLLIRHGANLEAAKSTLQELTLAGAGHIYTILDAIKDSEAAKKSVMHFDVKK